MQTFKDKSAVPDVGDILYCKEGGLYKAYLATSTGDSSRHEVEALFLNMYFKKYTLNYQDCIPAEEKIFDKQQEMIKNSNPSRAKNYRSKAMMSNFTIAFKAHKVSKKKRMKWSQEQIEIKINKKKSPITLRKKNSTFIRKENVCACFSVRKSYSMKVCQDASCKNWKDDRLCNDFNCHAKIRCGNRKTKVNDSRSKYIVRDVDGKGKGVFATKKIEIGEFITEYKGERISESEFQRRKLLKQPTDPFYFLKVESNLYIDPEFTNYRSKRINHSCNPNAMAQKFDKNGKTYIEIIAIKVIEEGDEITYNYGIPDNSYFTFNCMCDAEMCKKIIGNRD